MNPIKMFYRFLMCLISAFALPAFADDSARSITISNNTNTESLTVYMGFVGNTYGCYKASDFSFCTPTTGNKYVCSFVVPKATPSVINFPSVAGKSCQVSVAFTPQNQPWGACPTSLAEFTLNGIIGDKIQDTADVSFVNGVNYDVAIVASDSGSPININSALAAPGYNNVAGIFPPGCDECALSNNPPTWPGCPGKVPKSSCHKGTQSKPKPVCQISAPSDNNSYTVTFSEKAP